MRKINSGVVLTVLLYSIFLCFNGFSQIPFGYYDNATGLTGESLRTALYGIIKDHDEQSYSSLHTHYQTTDKKTDGKVWDMYSDIPNGTPAYTYTFDVDKCGSYAQEGDCYNREHTTPADWYNDAAPMYTDLFNVYPTDGYVNGKRNNYPYGDVAIPSWTSTNGSLLGTSADTGYVGTVFEPIDEYKGDFARTYFYMMTRYMDVVSSWSSPMYEGDNFSDWALRVLKKWAITDTVSPKEIDRNNAVYVIQDNRNPFIDHPEWVSEIWGDTLSGIEKANNKNNVKLWYATNSIYISDTKNENTEVKVFDISGRKILSFNTRLSYFKFPVFISSGVYFAVVTQYNSSNVLKFTVQ